MTDTAASPSAPNSKGNPMQAKDDASLADELEGADYEYRGPFGREKHRIIHPDLCDRILSALRRQQSGGAVKEQPAQAEAAVEVQRLQRELDITNADHIALWIEHNTIPDEPMNQCASWLACRIVEAHEAALKYLPDRIAARMGAKFVDRGPAQAETQQPSDGLVEDAAADIWRDLIAKPGECIAEKQIRVGGAMDQMPLTQALQRAMTQAAEAAAGRAWQPIETAPPYEVVEVLVGEHMTFLASLHPGASLDENEQPCDQWGADVEGEHPPCWTDGACWASNAEEVASLQPRAWRPAIRSLDPSQIAADTGEGRG